MDYRRFERLREPTLKELEERLDRAEKQPKSLAFEDLESLGVLYRQVLHDASLASARFPGTALERRLRRVSLRANRWLVRDSGTHLPSLRRFITETFPATFRRLLPTTGVAAALFTVAGLFGFAIASVDPSTGSLFLPPSALEGLARGQLWTDSIFAVTPGAVASGQIATNNLSVAITAWAGGALAGLGSLWVAMLNGLMLGTVLSVTAHYSMSSSLLEFIAAHGPLEISLILVSAGAGLHVGMALVRATDQPRSKVLRRAGLDSMVVLLGCLPWILLLGFVEGFVSPSPFLGPTAKLALGLALVAAFGSWAFRATNGPDNGSRSGPDTGDMPRELSS